MYFPPHCILKNYTYVHTLPPAIDGQAASMNLHMTSSSAHSHFQPSLLLEERKEGDGEGGLGTKRTRLAFTEELIISKQRVTTAVLLLRAAGISGGRPPGGCGPSREKSGIYSFSSSEHP